jgi:hypothetical protein
VQVTGKDLRPTTPQPSGPPSAAAAKRRPLPVWLTGIVIGSAPVAVGLLVYFALHRDPNEKVAINAQAQPPQRQSPSVPSVVALSPTAPSIKTPPAQLPDDKPESAEESNKNPGAADEIALQSAPPAAKPDEPLAIIASPSKEPPPDDRKGIIADAPPMPEPLGVPKDKKLGIVADTPEGLYGARTKPKTFKWLAQRGGTIDSEKAVNDGLDWLARHQGQDGHWGADCLGGADRHSRCEKRSPCQGPGVAYEIGQTGLALLAFQAAGHYDFNGRKYSGQVANGLNYCVQEQAPDGSVVGSQNPTPKQIVAGAKFDRNFMYEHAIGTFALCEACAVAVAEGKQPDPRYQKAAQRAVSFIEKVQHADGGWRYTTNASEQSDCSVSGWVMLALKTAREAKLDVSPETISRMTNFFATRYADGHTGYTSAGGGTDATTGLGMMAVEFFEHNLESPIVQNGASWLAQMADADAELPNAYVWYNCTMAMFQVGGEPWQRWNGVVRDHVASSQVQGEGCDRGSWSPDADVYGPEGGRIYTTALAVLTLEVYYRFQRVAGEPEKGKFFQK